MTPRALCAHAITSRPATEDYIINDRQGLRVGRQREEGTQRLQMLCCCHGDIEMVKLGTQDAVERDPKDEAAGTARATRRNVGYGKPWSVG